MSSSGSTATNRSPRVDRPRSDAVVMFGASGDLAKKKLFPALYRLTKRGLLGVPVIGVALDDWTDGDLRRHAEESIRAEEEWDDATFEAFAKDLRYVAGDYSKTETFEKLKATLGSADHPVFHCAIPPSMFQTVSAGLGSVGLNKGSRLIIEKPFGRDLESAIELNASIHEWFPESAIFRIDHFVGKEAMRNILIVRFANTILEPIWHRNYVRSIRVTMAEAFGVSDRGAFYDSVGALRDVMQNHLLQMVALIAMDQPANESSEALRTEKARLLASTAPIDPDHYVRGQYDGYRDVVGVKPDSDTETFGAFRLNIETPRWHGVPFFLRAGKAMAKTVTEITVEFQPPPVPLWLTQYERHELPTNRIRIEVKPDSFSAMTWLHKVPGDGMRAEAITIAPPAELRGDTGPEPYELLIEEAMIGDPALFARQDTIEESWRIVDPILREVAPSLSYDQGTWGPDEADRLVRGYGHWPSEPPAG
jgi:glucose-6-phosphate 1-dehydrogenase